MEIREKDVAQSLTALASYYEHREEQKSTWRPIRLEMQEEMDGSKHLSIQKISLYEGLIRKIQKIVCHLFYSEEAYQIFCKTFDQQDRKTSVHEIIKALPQEPLEQDQMEVFEKALQDVKMNIFDSKQCIEYLKVNKDGLEQNQQVLDPSERKALDEIEARLDEFLILPRPLVENDDQVKETPQGKFSFATIDRALFQKLQPVVKKVDEAFRETCLSKGISPPFLVPTKIEEHNNDDPSPHQKRSDKGSTKHTSTQDQDVALEQKESWTDWNDRFFTLSKS